MNRIILFLICALSCTSMMAQTKLIKEAEGAMNDNKPYSEVISIIKPAFTNPETSNQALTYFIAGKAGIQEHLRYLGLPAAYKLSAKESMDMWEALLDGYNFLMKALSLDEQSNQKGVSDPKLSKDIDFAIERDHVRLHNAGQEFWINNRYEDAYRCWKILMDLINDSRIKVTLPSYTIESLSDFAYNAGVSAWKCDKNKEALEAFLSSYKAGKKDKILYDYILSLAQSLKRNDVTLSVATEANEIYGTEDTSYIGFIANCLLEQQKFTETLSLINKAIAEHPDQAQLYVTKGILLEQDAIKGDAKSSYAKAVEIDPNNPQALNNLGRIIYNEAVVINDAAPVDDVEYSKVYYAQIKPLLLQSVELLEKAAKLQAGYKDPLYILQNAYYLLHDAAGQQSVEQRLK